MGIHDRRAEKGYKIAGYPIRDFLTNFYQSTYDRELEKFAYPPNQVESLRSISIRWYLDSVAEPEYATALFAGIVYTMQQKYGTPTSCIFQVTNQNDELSNCNIDIPTTYIDLTNVAKAIENQEELISLNVIFNNVNMSLRCSYREDSSSYFYYVSAFFRAAPMDISEVKDQPHYDYADVADTRRVNGVGF